MISNTVCSRLANIVSGTPNEVAITQDGSSLTFAELDQLANKVAARLLASRSAQPGFVGILAENRIAAIAAMLGTARIGHAYVPLDPADPVDRLRVIVQDCRPFVILADKNQLDCAKSLTEDGCVYHNLDDILLGPSAPQQHSLADENSLLYLLYTSGSTGKPKGVCQTHRNLLFFVDAYAETLGIRRGDHVSMVYTLSFSASNMDIYGALLYGATLCPYDMRRDGIPKFAEWLIKNEVSIFHAVPTVMRELTRTLSPSCHFPQIRAVDLGGEALFAEDVARFRSRVGSECVFVNHLAATEISVIAQHIINPGDALMKGPLPAGKSPKGVQVTILRQDGTKANKDETGIIAIDSPYLSPGYWNNRELDSAVFSETEGQPGWRRYISGDLGRVDEDGLLHFIGREGSRIKIRGQSIDLNEVEAALHACQGISEAAVIAQGEEGREAQKLIAYVVMMPMNDPAPLELRKQLKEKLPTYMLPSGYIFLDQLPHTTTGKVDKRGLFSKDLAVQAYRPDYVEPANELEARIASIFSQVLNFEPVGRFDDFFLLGGDSMTLVTLQLQFRNSFGHDAPDIYEEASVAGVAERMRSTDSGSIAAMPCLIPLRARGSRTPLYLVHGRFGQAFVSPHFANQVGEDQPIYAIQARGLDGLEPPCTTVEDMATEYLAAIRARQPSGPYFIGALCAGGYVAIEMARQLKSHGEKVLPLLLFDPPDPLPRRRVIIRKRELIRRLTLRKQQNRWSVDVDNKQFLLASKKVAQAFEDALRSYRPLPYDGAVFMMVSSARLPRGYRKNSTLAKILTGPTEYHLAGSLHSDMLNPANEIFAFHLAECMEKIRQNITPRNNISEILIGNENSLSRCGAWRRRLRRLFRL